MLCCKMAYRGRLSIEHCIKTVLVFFMKLKWPHKDSIVLILKFYDHPHFKTAYMEFTTHVRTPQNVVDVRAEFLRSPSKSTRTAAAAAFGISRQSVQ